MATVIIIAMEMGLDIEPRFLNGSCRRKVEGGANRHAMQKWNIIGDAKVPTYAKGGMSTSSEMVKTSHQSQSKMSCSRERSDKLEQFFGRRIKTDSLTRHM